MNKNKFSTTAFTRFGPMIGTFIIVISFHILIFLDHPARFLEGLVTPSVIIPMFLLMLIAIAVGYVIGYIPAFITGELFLHIFRKKLPDANLYKIILYSLFIGLMWAPILLIILLFFEEMLISFLYLQFVFIIPITTICSVLEWKKLKKYNIFKV